MQCRQLKSLFWRLTSSLNYACIWGDRLPFLHLNILQLEVSCIRWRRSSAVGDHTQGAGNIVQKRASQTCHQRQPHSALIFRESTFASTRAEQAGCAHKKTLYLCYHCVKAATARHPAMELHVHPCGLFLAADLPYGSHQLLEMDFPGVEASCPVTALHGPLSDCNFG